MRSERSALGQSKTRPMASHDKHIARRLADDMLGDAAQQYIGQAGAAAGSDHDQVGIHGFGESNNFVAGMTVHHFPADGSVLTTDLAQEHFHAPARDTGDSAPIPDDFRCPDAGPSHLRFDAEADVKDMHPCGGSNAQGELERGAGARRKIDSDQDAPVSFPSRAPHDQYGTVAFADDLFCGGPDQKILEVFLSMSADHDEIGVLPAPSTYDLHESLAPADANRRLFAEMSEKLRRILREFLSDALGDLFVVLVLQDVENRHSRVILIRDLRRARQRSLRALG